MTPGEISAYLGGASFILTAFNAAVNMRRGGRKKRKSQKGRHRKR
ncbi:hypothetical protein [Streptomyces sp. NPDC001889]